ncbi:MAG: hypothetical protein AB3N19_12130 [Ruegeria sp.]
MAETEDPRFVDYVSEAKYLLTYETEALSQISKALLTSELSIQALSRVFVALETAALEHPDVAEAIEDAELDPTSFSYIGYDLRDFLRVMVELDSMLAADPDYAHGQFRYRPVRLMEVGCGPGRNLFILQNGGLLLWSTIEGIDVVQPYIDVARSSFNLGDSVWQDDARTLDYSPYDVVFSHRPFSDARAQADYEKRLVSQMKTGAYLVAPLNETHAQDSRLVSLGDTEVIWKRL